MPRLAWFTPLPPAMSGVSQYNAELLPGLAAAHAIDLFVDQPPDQILRPAPDMPVYSAHDFVWKHFREPYDLIVYQLGNAHYHDYMWAYLVRYPGLVVLHDGQFHHARERQLLQQNRAEDYRTEFAFNHPDANADLAELGIAGLLGSLTYLWPMRRVVTSSARLVVVHNSWLAGEIREEQPHVNVRVVDMGVPAHVSDPVAADAIRARHQIPQDAVLFVAFGEVTPEKRISQAIHGLASMSSIAPRAHLLLAGRPAGHYNARAEAAALGVSDRVTVAGFIAQDDVPAYLAAADVCLCMRWPSSRETSAAWLRCLAAGRATISTDLAHTVDIPALDPRAWALRHAPSAPAGDTAPLRPVEPACVSIDILDEDHSLRLAMRRLAADARLRNVLGESARRLWAERFTLEGMVAAYLRVIEDACASPAYAPHRPPDIPEHFLTDGTEDAARLLREMNVPESQMRDMWQSLSSPLSQPRLR